MRKSTRFFTLLLGAAMLVQLQGCYGSFNLTRKVYAFNGTLGDKWINSLATWVLIIIPVYGLAGLADFAVLNTIEFWTGTNPVALNPGEKDVQVVQSQDGTYKLTATSNRLDVQKLVDGKFQEPVSLVFDIRTGTWSAVTPNEQRKIIEMVGETGRIADLIYPDGKKQRVELAAMATLRTLPDR